MQVGKHHYKIQTRKQNMTLVAAGFQWLLAKIIHGQSIQLVYDRLTV